eukprot:2227368-Alexandrium_andersonii.AAC.1
MVSSYRVMPRSRSCLGLSSSLCQELRRARSPRGMAEVGRSSVPSNGRTLSSLRPKGGSRMARGC